jgi:hypothetical protein
VWLQLPLFGPADSAVSRDQRVFALRGDTLGAHEVVVETAIGLGELACSAHCPCHGTTALHLDFVRGDACGCDVQILDFMGRLATTLQACRTTCWADNVRAHITALAVRARKTVDTEVASLTKVAHVELRRWWYGELVEGRAQHTALLEFYRARPAMLRIMVWLGDAALLELAARGARVRDIETALARACGDLDMSNGGPLSAATPSWAAWLAAANSPLATATHSNSS